MVIHGTGSLTLQMSLRKGKANGWVVVRVKSLVGEASSEPGENKGPGVVAGALTVTMRWRSSLVHARSDGEVAS